jgi:cytochrome c oxidase subunit 3
LPLAEQTRAEHHAAVAHHFDDIEQQHEANILGMWVFLGTEILFFGGLLLGYVVYRATYPAAFAEGSRHLDLVLGGINTAVLLGSSLLMALAVQAARNYARRTLVIFLLLTALLGAAFLGIKGWEYYHHYQHELMPILGLPFGLTGPEANRVQLFFNFYYALTGLHALHLIIGVGVVTTTAILAWRGWFTHPEADYVPVELVGLYWHFVDIVWVFLYPLLYLLRH